MANVKPPLNDSDCFGNAIRWHLATVGSIRWKISPSLPIGLFCVLLMILIVIANQNRPIDLRSMADLGLLIALPIAWFGGIVAQAMVVQLGRWQLEPAAATLTIGGVWTAGPRRASRLLWLWSTILIVLALFSLSSAIADRWLVKQAVLNSDQIVPLVAAIDRPAIAIAWLWLIQGIWQVLPLPQSLGRGGWSAVIGLLWGQPSRPSSTVTWVRRWITACAFLVLLIGLAMLYQSGILTQPGGQAGASIAGVALLTLWLLVSARGRDLTAWQTRLAQTGQLGRLNLSRWRQERNAHRLEIERKQHLQATWKREHDEASEATRADEILERLHEQGVDALSPADRELLERVSNAIRRQRSS